MAWGSAARPAERERGMEPRYLPTAAMVMQGAWAPYGDWDAELLEGSAAWFGGRWRAPLSVGRAALTSQVVKVGNWEHMCGRKVRGALHMEDAGGWQMKLRTYP